jgi:hypothetical protein
MERWLERAEERVRDVAEHVAGFARDAVERVMELGDWLAG